MVILHSDHTHFRDREDIYSLGTEERDMRDKEGMNRILCAADFEERSAQHGTYGAAGLCTALKHSNMRVPGKRTWIRVREWRESEN